MLWNAPCLTTPNSGSEGTAIVCQSSGVSLAHGGSELALEWIWADSPLGVWDLPKERVVQQQVLVEERPPRELARAEQKAQLVRSEEQVELKEGQMALAGLTAARPRVQVREISAPVCEQVWSFDSNPRMEEKPDTQGTYYARWPNE